MGLWVERCVSGAGDYGRGGYGCGDHVPS
uniref:Uncharacterized protein n=1 Tax=Anguilla anguilla TaxID=7936 RepID=A0A0E9RVX3_ANGAN